ncbi:MAG: hypothetical protein ACRD2Z_16940, partial [Thermoanaerobaculia bacterium]
MPTGLRILVLGSCVSTAFLACATGGSGKKPGKATEVVGTKADGLERETDRVAPKAGAESPAAEAAGKSSNAETAAVEDDDSVVVISAPDPAAHQPATLVEAAAAARAQRAAAGPPVAAITDENLGSGRRRDRVSQAGASARADSPQIPGDEA